MGLVGSFSTFADTLSDQFRSWCMANCVPAVSMALSVEIRWLIIECFPSQHPWAVPSNKLYNIATENGPEWIYLLNMVDLSMAMCTLTSAEFMALSPYIPLAMAGSAGEYFNDLLELQLPSDQRTSRLQEVHQGSPGCSSDEFSGYIMRVHIVLVAPYQ